MSASPVICRCAAAIATASVGCTLSSTAVARQTPPAVGRQATSAVARQTPLAVRAASLSQQGRRLRWTVSLDRLLSTTAMSRQRRSLCLLIGGAASKRSSALLCLAPGGRGAEAELRFARIDAEGISAWRTIEARVRRPGPDALTATFAPASIGLGYAPLRWRVESSIEPPACAPGSAPDGASEGARSCTLFYPTGPRLARLHTPELVGCVAHGPSLISGGPSSGDQIALTFDDGPWGDPPSIDFVKELARYHASATFFEIGDQINEYDPTGSIERRMLADGDMIGDHTWTHPDMATLPGAQQRSQLELTADAVRAATGFTPCLWRAPYGDISEQLDRLARSLGFLTIGWNIDPRDWSLPGVAAIEDNVLANARPGGIVEMHFGGGPRQETLAALPRIITTLRARGYRFVTVAKMLGLRMIYR
jgi:peptidoglycan-N-acetylglucosamine deacetylase